ncbi:MAG TPA: formate--tetrahydrofolate ligase, partial [Actinomycetota bacterium]
MKSGLEIAQEAELRPITEIASSAGIPDDVLEPFGRYRAKVDLSILDHLADR